MDLHNGIQSALNPQGPHADAVASLSWVLFYGAAAIFVFIIALTAYAILSPVKRRTWAANKRLVIAGGIVFPIVTLSALLVYIFATARAVVPQAVPADMRIEVIGEQWWWRVNYLDSKGEIDFTSANEIRIPVGRSIDLELKSADVIHSFWVPNLAGKLDMIPGRVNRLRITAEREGVFRGQCAEYCGGPHALMAFYVIAVSEQGFEAWREGQQRPAVSVGDTSLERGRALFLASCAVCHTVRGTPAQGTLGPDLTHLASRVSIAAGTLPNNPGTLAGWVSSSQHIKPGNLMPSMNLYSGAELTALAAYLTALQ